MWLLEFLFFGITLLLGWTMFGYFLFIWFIKLFNRREPPSFPASWPQISIVVPCYNERHQIIEKLDNLKALQYPRNCLEIVFADGGSSDQTAEVLSAAIKEDESIRFVKCPSRGKINQLNHVLPQLHGEIIVNTDADARLLPDALQWIAAEFAAAPDVQVVGAYSHPVCGLDIENYYWDAQNKGRFLESDAMTSSIVIAQCYAFRRELLETFPEDVVADDVYVAFLANTMGYRTIYSHHAIAVETRGPENYSQFLPHKFRKSNAFLRESLRFIYRLPEMSPFWKTVFVTKIFQQLCLPWAMLVWTLLAGSLLTLFRFDLVIFAGAFLIIFLLIANRIFSSVKLPEEQKRYSFSTVVKGFLLTTMLLLTTGISYPFFIQGSSYARLGKEPRQADGAANDDQPNHGG